MSIHTQELAPFLEGVSQDSTKIHHDSAPSRVNFRIILIRSLEFQNDGLYRKSYLEDFKIDHDFYVHRID